jgi:hypothetical protein
MIQAVGGVTYPLCSVNAYESELDGIRDQDEALLEGISSSMSRPSGRVIQCQASVRD